MAEVESTKEIIDKASAKVSKINSGVVYVCETCGSDGHPTSEHGKLGGKRSNQGGVRGYRKKTLEKMKVKKAMNQRIMAHTDRILNSQLEMAVGEQCLFVKVKERDSKGKITRQYFDIVDDIEIIKQYLDFQHGINNAEDPSTEDEWYYITTKRANNKAADSLLDRAFGKPTDKIEVSGGFFTTTNVNVNVTGNKHGDIQIGDDGTIIDIEPESGPNPEQEASSSDTTTQ